MAESLDEGDMGASAVSHKTMVSSAELEDMNKDFKTVGYSKGYSANAGTIDGRIHVKGVKILNSRSLDPYQAKQLSWYHVRRVLSPFEFYLEKDLLKAGESQQRHTDMQAFYNKRESEAYEYIIHVSKMLCYAYYDPKSKSWWRVCVRDVDQGDAYVYYCDTGRQEYVECTALRQLTKEFLGSLDSAILKCYLYDVLPIDGTLKWSLNAIAFFKEFIENKQVKAVVLKSTNTPVVDFSPDRTTTCGVVLTDSYADSPETLNWLVVKMGYARSIGMASCSQNIFDIDGIIPHFEIPETPKTPKVKKRKSDSEGISLEELHEITNRIIANSGPDYYKPVYMERPYEIRKDAEKYLPFEIRSKLAWVRLSFMVGPGMIYLHSRSKRLELKAMEFAIKKVSKKLPHPKTDSLNPGSFVTCDLRDVKFPEENAWARALVLNVDKNRKAVSVLLVDYGNMMLVGSSVIYQLPKEYRSIPSFVHRVHLSDIRPNFEVPYWHHTIDDVFTRYLLSHEMDMPIYYAHVADKTEMVEFTDYGLTLNFNDATKQWIASHKSVKKSGEFDVINSLKSDPLLASHFVSHAVRIFYEVAVQEIDFWVFENVSSYLVKREHALFSKPPVNKDKLHEIIRKGCGTL